MGLVAAAALLLGVVGSAGCGRAAQRFGVPCSEISANHLYMQTNLRAYLVVKGCAALGAKPETAPEGVASAASPALSIQVGGTDRDVISPQETTVLHDTQGGSMVAAKGNTIVVDYNGAPKRCGPYGSTFEVRLEVVVRARDIDSGRGAEEDARVLRRGERRC